jgi:hypothetical protein
VRKPPIKWSATAETLRNTGVRNERNQCFITLGTLALLLRLRLSGVSRIEC